MGGRFSEPSNLIGSIIGRFLVGEHRHRSEQDSLVSGVEEISWKHEESIVSLLLSPGLVGGLRGRNPLLVVSSVTTGVSSQ